MLAVFYNNLQETGIEIGNYHQLNLGAGLVINDVALKLAVNNVTNSDELTWVNTLLADGRALRLRPRTISLGLKYTF